MERGVLRNASLVQAPQLMLVNRSEYGIQVQQRIDQERLVAAPADPSYLTWQGVPHLIGQVPNQLSHHFGWYSSDTP